MQLVIGVDEAGRGPLAGPVAIGGVAVPADFDFFTAFPGLNDSKRLSEKKRERIFTLMMDLRGPSFGFCVRFVSAKVIDRKGIMRAVASATARVARTLMPEPSAGHVLLDGLLSAPEEYGQTTIIHGDETEPAIMLASVAAKVMRDRLMVKLATKYPAYGFEKHKGYGTVFHINAIAHLGLSPIHRRTFCSNFISS